MDKTKKGSLLGLLSMKVKLNKMVFGIAVLSCLAVSPLQARLGEDESELAKRFGAPIETQKVTKLDFIQHIYQNHDLLIGVTLIDGKSASEQYTRTTGKTDAEGKPILTVIPEEIAQAILKANANGGEWQEVSKDQEARRFMRSDKQALAVFFTGRGFISEIRISSAEFNRHLFPKVTE